MNDLRAVEAKVSKDLKNLEGQVKENYDEKYSFLTAICVMAAHILTLSFLCPYIKHETGKAT